MTHLTVVRVFVDEHGDAGNPLGIFVDGNAIPRIERQRVAADLNFSETVFVLDVAQGRLEIFTPVAELSFAGHPLVGTSWLLREQGRPAAILRPPAGEVATWVEDGTTWIRGRPEWVPPMEVRRFDSPQLVDQLAGAPPGVDVLYAWAWIDESAGLVRARFFAPGLGIPEDEATGAAALRLTGMLGRPVTVRQGRGSILHGRPSEGGSVEVGGRVSLLSRAPYALMG